MKITGLSLGLKRFKKMRKKHFLCYIIFTFLFFFIVDNINAEDMYIENIGMFGFENIDHEYTASQVVILNLNITSNATKCSYSNDDIIYSNYESCTQIKYWVLSSSLGNKTVYVNINHTNGIIVNHFDTIYYNTTGAGLDTTPPSKVSFLSSNYSDDNSTVSVKFSDAKDIESTVLDIELEYYYRIYLNDTLINSTWKNIFDNSIVAYINTSDNDNVTFEVSVVNSAGLTNMTNFTVNMDFIKPNITYLNSTHNNTSWHNIDNITFFWNATDNKKLHAYSYVFASDNDIVPDDIVEMYDQGVLGLKNKTFMINYDGIYYFKIIAIDKASNPSDVKSYKVMVDNTAPTKPLMKKSSKKANSTNLTFSWISSEDTSGISYYEIFVSEHANFSEYDAKNTTLTSAEFDNLSIDKIYYAKVRAFDNVGLFSIWSNEVYGTIDNIPPVISFISPKGNVAHENPIIILKTDEKAICNINNKTFRYTNSVYHETKINIPTTPFELNITCTDNSDNTASIFETISAITQDETPDIISPSTVDTYANLKITINLTLSNSLEGFSKKDFTLKRDDKNILFNIHPTTDPDNYLLTFMGAEKQGTYNLDINGHEIVEDCSSLKLTVSYSNPNMTDIETFSKQTIYGKVNKTYIGLMKNDKIYELFQSSTNFSVTFDYGLRSLLFFSERLSNLKNKEKLFLDDVFLDQKISAIGNPKISGSTKRIIFSHEELFIQGSKKVFKNGIFNLIIRLDSIDDGKKNIIITETKNDAEEVLIYQE